jgi:hypothetical protein
MAVPNVRRQISAGVGSGENKKLKIKSIFLSSSRKFRPLKKKKKKKKKLEELGGFFFWSIVRFTEAHIHTNTHTHTHTHNTHSHAHTPSNPPKRAGPL